MVAFVASSNVIRSALNIRRLGELDASLLPGTEQPFATFFSPDGQSLGEAPTPLGGWWAEDNTIVFGGFGRGLMRVSAAGGQATPITTLGKDETGHTWPQVLPGGRAVLYTVPAIANNPGSSAIMAAVLLSNSAGSPNSAAASARTT